MTIDTARLATDAGYWIECGAPEDATHYEPGEQDPECWAKIVGDRIMHWSPFEEWHVWNPKGMDGRFIPRPQSEWVGKLPQIGEEVEATWLELPDGGARDYEPVLIKGYFGTADKQVWLATRDGYDLVCRMDHCSFRPIRTKAQRDREKLAKTIDSALASDDTPYHLADAIIAAGWTKP